MTRALVGVGLVLVLGNAVIASEPKKSAPPPAQESDTQRQLLQEVRRLREALEAMVSTGARVQIVFGRLQLQEQRTATAARRLDDLREHLARVTQETSRGTAGINELEERLRDSRVTPEERKNFENGLAQLKRHVEIQEAERQRLQTEEAQAAAVLATEQARWSDLNQQLEDLERALSKPLR